jgi:hypothetical protein
MQNITFYLQILHFYYRSCYLVISKYHLRSYCYIWYYAPQKRDFKGIDSVFGRGRMETERRKFIGMLSDDRK